MKRAEFWDSILSAVGDEYKLSEYDRNQFNHARNELNHAFDLIERAQGRLIEVLPHPPEVLDADPALIADMKRRLAEPKRESEPESIFERD